MLSFSVGENTPIQVRSDNYSWGSCPTRKMAVKRGVLKNVQGLSGGRSHDNGSDRDNLIITNDNHFRNHHSLWGCWKTHEVVMGTA
jgi:hypothetical protein